jgi:hypothetical protein
MLPNNVNDSFFVRCMRTSPLYIAGGSIYIDPTPPTSTGTPPRLDGRTIDYSRLSPQPSEDPPVPFSFMTEEVAQRGRFVQCHMTHTNKAAHDIVVGEGRTAA